MAGATTEREASRGRRLVNRQRALLNVGELRVRMCSRSQLCDRESSAANTSSMSRKQPVVLRVALLYLETAFATRAGGWTDLHSRSCVRACSLVRSLARTHAATERAAGMRRAGIHKDKVDAERHARCASKRARERVTYSVGTSSSKIIGPGDGKRQRQRRRQ